MYELQKAESYFTFLPIFLGSILHRAKKKKSLASMAYLTPQTNVCEILAPLELIVWGEAALRRLGIPVIANVRCRWFKALFLLAFSTQTYATYRASC